MSKTGKYIWGWDEEKQKMTWVKASDRAHLKSNVYFPEADSHSGHHFENLGKTVYSKQEKRDVMNKMGVAEL